MIDENFSFPKKPFNRMGVNGQKRKKKQGPVPSLEETLPKRFKSEKNVKPKKAENGAKTNGSAKPSSKKISKIATRQGEHIDEEIVDKEQDFGATKASLFDDDDEFEGLEDNVDMYVT